MKNKVIKIINTYLLNNKGNIEGQRLAEKWFKSRDLLQELELFIDLDILNTQKLYNYINSTAGICSCGDNKRFIGFSKGYKEYCRNCGRAEFQKQKAEASANSTSIISLLELKKALEDSKDQKGSYSSSKLYKITNLNNSLIYYTSYLKTDAKNSERIYHIVNNLKEYPKCKMCSENLDNFISNAEGYRSEFCKANKCAVKSINRSNQQQSLRIYFYKNYVEKYKDLIQSDYTYEFFSEADYLEASDLCNIKLQHTACGFNYEVNVKYQGHIKCPKCFPVRSRTQYEIFEFLKEHTANIKFNDRKLIAPKELDIFVPDLNFAIEYDSLSYHSYGYHTKPELNNTLENKKMHLEKTEACELKNVQLFRIFSNEWLNSSKQAIWKSVLLSKMHLTEKIPARKCSIREVDNYSSSSFLDANHMQGNCGARVKLGLYYNDGIKDELVSLMTFGTPRENKKYQWELIRFCSKLGTTVQGGGSKLLKFFERNYNPESLISYANRRWSEGNLYEKLGFEFLRNTEVNYFYFKGNDSATLFSRNKFQKHKLSKELVVFDESKTETENMYANKYRKIFDSGNKVYLKRY